MCVRSIVVVIFPAFLAIAEPIAAQTRTIAVTGSGEVRVVPDQVTIRVGIDSFAATLDAAKKDNDERTRRVLAVANSAKVDPRDVQTSSRDINPSYEETDSGEYQRDKLIGYNADTTVSITLHDLAQLEPVLGSVLEAGANSVNGIEFETTKLNEHREEARTLALLAAREKAVKMAGVLGQKVGRPLEISEQEERWSSARWAAPMAAGSVAGPSAGAPSGGETFAFGQITVQVRVKLVSELE